MKTILFMCVLNIIVSGNYLSASDSFINGKLPSEKSNANQSDISPVFYLSPISQLQEWKNSMMYEIVKKDYKKLILQYPWLLQRIRNIDIFEQEMLKTYLVLATIYKNNEWEKYFRKDKSVYQNFYDVLKVNFFYVTYHPSIDPVLVLQQCCSKKAKDISARNRRIDEYLTRMHKKIEYQIKKSIKLSKFLRPYVFLPPEVLKKSRFYHDSSGLTIFQNFIKRAITDIEYWGLRTNMNEDSINMAFLFYCLERVFYYLHQSNRHIDENYLMKSVKIIILNSWSFPYFKASFSKESGYTDLICLTSPKIIDSVKASFPFAFVDGKKTLGNEITGVTGDDNGMHIIPLELDITENITIVYEIANMINHPEKYTGSAA